VKYVAEMGTGFVAQNLLEEWTQSVEMGTGFVAQNLLEEWT
jgi:hypothetical protein